MIIKTMEFTNIYRYCGTERFVLPFDGASNLTVIIGRSNAGKSTLIKCLKFLLYGVNGRGLSEVDAKACVNREALRRVKEGAAVTAAVKVKFSNGNLEHTMTRLLTVSRRGARNLDVEIVEEACELRQHTGVRDIIMNDVGKANLMLAQVVPPSLFNFYFFQGEEVARELLKPHVDQTIASALLDVFYKSDWARATSDLREVQREFAKKRSAAAGENRQLRKLGDEKDSLTAEREDLVQRLTLQKAIFEKTQKDHEQVDHQFLATYDNEKEHQHLLDLREQVKIGQRHEDELFTQLKQAIGTEGLLAFMTPSFGVAKKTLEVLRSQGRLPPDVSADLVSRLLRESHCICGTSLSKDCDARQALEKLQAQCMSAVLGRDLAALYDSVSSADSAFPAKAKALGAKCRQLWQKYQSAVNDNANVLEALRLAEGKHDPRARARREQLKQKRDELAAELRKTGVAVDRLSNEIRTRDSRLAEIANELRRVRGVPEEAKKWQACEDMAERLAGYVVQFEENLLRFCHRRLQQLTAAMYDETVNDGSVAWINPETLLPSIRHGTQSGGAWGGGQSQVLILSYICALSELRKEVCERMRDLFAVNMVNDQCFFMDCVFGAMEPKYQASVARSLRGRMKQLVLLFNPTQWTEAIRDELDGHIHQAYALRNSVTRDETDEYQHVTYYGRPVQLSFTQTEGTESVTVTQEIT